MKRIYLLLVYVFCCGLLAAQSCLPGGTLASGVYIIQVMLDNGVFSDKFIVK